VFRSQLLRGNEGFFQQLDQLFHSSSSAQGSAGKGPQGAPAGGGPLRLNGQGVLVSRHGPAPYAELLRIVESHVHHADWYQVDLDLRSRAAALSSSASVGSRAQAERAISKDLQIQISNLKLRVSEATQLEAIRRQELAELQAKGPPVQVDSSAVEPLLLQVKDVIDHLIKVEQGVTSWEERAADLDKERARLASEAESEREVRAQINEASRERRAASSSLENTLQRQRTQWDHERQELLMEASRIRSARIHTERVIAETRDTLRGLTGELESTLYVVILGEKKVDEAHSKFLQIHSMSQAVTLDIDAQMQSQGGVPGLFQGQRLHAPNPSLRQDTTTTPQWGGRNPAFMHASLDSAGLRGLGLEAANLAAIQGGGGGGRPGVHWHPGLARIPSGGEFGGGVKVGSSSGLESLDLAVPVAVRGWGGGGGGGAREEMGAADPFMSRIGLNNMTDKVLGSVVRAGGRAELASQWMQDYRAAPNPLQAGDEYRGMPEIPRMESGLFRLQGPALKKPETHAQFHTNPASGTHHHRQYFSKVSMQ
jgi:hypothetical protein